MSNIAPKQTSKMVHDFLNGNIEEAQNFQLDSIPLINALFSEVNPIPVKEALNMMGYNYGVPRLPLVRLSEKNQERLKNSMKNFGLI